MHMRDTDTFLKNKKSVAYRYTQMKELVTFQILSLMRAFFGRVEILLLPIIMNMLIGTYTLVFMAHARQAFIYFNLSPCSFVVNSLILVSVTVYTYRLLYVHCILYIIHMYNYIITLLIIGNAFNISVHCTLYAVHCTLMVN